MINDPGELFRNVLLIVEELVVDLRRVLDALLYVVLQVWDLVVVAEALQLVDEGLIMQREQLLQSPLFLITMRALRGEGPRTRHAQRSPNRTEGQASRPVCERKAGNHI